MVRLKGVVYGIYLIVLSTVSTSAGAAPPWCSGTVLSSWTQADGNVYISSTWRQDQTQICNLKTDWKGVPADVCVGCGWPSSTLLPR